MNKKLRILVLVHPDLTPPNSVSSRKIFDDQFVPWKTEFDVVTALKELGHEVLILGVYDSLLELKDILDSIKIDLVFNLLEEFNGKSELDYQITQFLEKEKVKYTGCSTTALKLGRDKAKSKELVKSIGYKTPNFIVCKKGQKIKLDNLNLSFPLIVKCLTEEASYGLSKESVVNNVKTLEKRINYMHKKLKVDCIIEEFIEGEEIYISFMGGKKNDIFTPRKLHFPKSKNPLKEIYTSMAKWSYSYARRQKIFTRHKELSPFLMKKLQQETIKICEALKINAQARIDFRITKDNEIYFLEANPNPNISQDDDFCLSAIRKYGTYNKIIEEIIKIALESKKQRSNVEKIAA